MAREYHFLFTVLGHYPARVRGNAPHVTVNMAAGRGSHLIHCGTLTMSEDEWDAFVGALKTSLGRSVEVTDARAPHSA